MKLQHFDHRFTMEQKFNIGLLMCLLSGLIFTSKIYGQAGTTQTNDYCSTVSNLLARTETVIASATNAAAEAVAAAKNADTSAMSADQATKAVKNLIDDDVEKNKLDDGIDDAIEQAGHSLDKIEKHLAEWGHASVSGFVMVPDRTGFFNLDYSNPMSNYVSNIRSNTQGTASFLEQSEFTDQLTIRAANAVPGLNVQGPAKPLSSQQQAALQSQNETDALVHQIQMAQLQKELARITNSADGWQTNALTLPTNSNAASITNGPTGPTNVVVVTPIITNVINGSSITNGFSPLGKLAAGSSGNQLSETTVLKLAGTAKETERILNYMSHPIDLPGNKQMFFALGQVSVMPGWRTKQDYICEVSTTFRYNGTNAPNVSQKQRTFSVGPSAIPDPNDLSLVSAFPLVESQVFDMQNSYRSQMTLLLNLAGTYLQAGYKVDFENLMKYVKQIQKDISTRTALPTVIPGVDACVLTYRFDPEVSAMVDPSQIKPKSGSQLLPLSIPVMVLVVGEKKNFQKYPQIALEVETRWIPKSRRNFWQTTFVDLPWKGRVVDKRMSYSHEADLIRAFDEADKRIQSLGSLHYGELTSELKRRFNSIKNLAWGKTVVMDLPGKEPVASRILPAKLKTTDINKTLSIYGENLIADGRATKVRVGGLPLLAVGDSSTLTATIGFGGDSIPLTEGVYNLEVETTQGICIVSNAVTIEKPKVEIQPKDRPPIEISSILPQNGFINAQTTFVALGSGFKPEKNNDPIQIVLVGGHAVTNLSIISDNALRFDVPAWNKDGTNLWRSDLDVIFASACVAINAKQKLVFDIKIPPTPVVKETPAAQPTESDKANDRQVSLLKAVQALNPGSTTPQFSGTLKLDLGAPTNSTSTISTNK